MLIKYNRDLLTRDKMAARVGLQPAKSVVTCRLLSSRRFLSFKYGVGSNSSSIFQQQKGAGCDAISVLLLFPSLFAFSHHSPRLTLRFCADDPGTSKRISRANSSPLGGDRGGQRQAGGPGPQVESLPIKQLLADYPPVIGGLG
jgi:hypothetical protein